MIGSKVLFKTLQDQFEDDPRVGKILDKFQMSTVEYVEAQREAGVGSSRMFTSPVPVLNDYYLIESSESIDLISIPCNFVIQIVR